MRDVGMYWLIRELRIIIIGPVRQELLSGISEPNVFENFKKNDKKYASFASINILLPANNFVSKICA